MRRPDPARPLSGVEHLLAVRGTLTAGEVVTLLVPLARELASLHDEGLALAARATGGLRAGDAALHDGGRPALAPLAPAAPGGQALERADLADLVALGWRALGGPAADVPTALAGVLNAALDAPEEAAPSAAQLARALLDACPARALQLPPGTPLVAAAQESAAPALAAPDRDPDPVRADDRDPVRAAGRRRRPRRGTGVRRAVVAGVAVLALVLLAGAVLHLRPSPARAAAGLPTVSATAATPQPVATAPASTPAPSWSGVVSALDARRAAAFAHGDPAALATVYVPGSPALARDTEMLAAYARAGAVADGLRPRLLAVDGAPGSVDAQVLRVRDVLDGWVLRRGAAQVRRPGRAARTWTLELRRVAGEWRVWDVSAAVSGSSPGSPVRSGG
ncbi:hypothetical protein EV189_1354 [Motilibacter rhizosphaerae]|uniref:Uncharacterized protein n=1 Tax=Motilibacter rhizosphaerae TaxID=598652 RepID=A0A4Q7NRA6_9ACTN|nr:nuclear transport factor 2 family protein [Motilibacter rhizosphaerae]RZS89587.1 hypothetical protein EV189_1354 [Motilibacter rhizosphaerae]